MNAAINDHFDQIEAVLIDSPAVLTYQITRREVGPMQSSFNSLSRQTMESWQKSTAITGKMPTLGGPENYH